MMSHSQSSGADYKGRAIVLLSGLSNESPTQAIEAVLRSYSLRIDGQQEITMAGRYIGAFELSLDPAHASAIENELHATFSPLGLDIALEIL